MRAGTHEPCRNRAAIDVDFCRIDLQLAVHREGLRGEGFVQLDEVEILDGSILLAGTLHCHLTKVSILEFVGCRRLPAANDVLTPQR